MIENILCSVKLWMAGYFSVYARQGLSQPHNEVRYCNCQLGILQDREIMMQTSNTLCLKTVNSLCTMNVSPPLRIVMHYYGQCNRPYWP